MNWRDESLVGNEIGKVFELEDPVVGRDGCIQWYQRDQWCDIPATARRVSIAYHFENGPAHGEFAIVHPVASAIVSTAWKTSPTSPEPVRGPLSRWTLQELEECSCFSFRLRCEVNKRGPRLPHPARSPFIVSSCGSTTGRPRCRRPISANHLRR